MRLVPLLVLVLIASAAPRFAQAQDVYVVLEEHPAIGSSIKRRLVTWPVPINRTWDELSPEHRAIVRQGYRNMAPGDEPPYPLRGMEPLLRDIALIQKGGIGEGPVRMIVKVDETGEAQVAAAVTAPNPQVAQVVGFALMQQKYKPGTCGGQVCTRDYHFEHTFTREARSAPSQSYSPNDPTR